MSPVKNQKKCGSCYIFTALSALESQYLIRREQNVEFSEQAILNCLPTGCNGGKVRNVWGYIKKHGVPEKSKCSYRAKVGENTISVHLSTIAKFNYWL